MEVHRRADMVGDHLDPLADLGKRDALRQLHHAVLLTETHDACPRRLTDVPEPIVVV